MKQRDLGLVGLWIFLGSTTVLFAALVFSYATLRVQCPDWRAVAAVLPLWRAALSTAVLFASSLLLRAGADGGGYYRAALGSGWAFLAMQAWLVRDLFLAGVGLETGLARSLLALLAGVHGVHVLGGLVALTLAGADPERRRLAALFWHFVDVSWVLMFVALFIV